MANVAAFDGGIATWNEKFRYDAVRPFSAIRFLYGDRRSPHGAARARAR